MSVPDERMQGGSDVAAALDELRRRHTALIDAIPDFVWLKSLEGRFLAVNAAFAAYLGRHPAQVVGRLDAELFPPELVRRFREQEVRVVADDVALVVEEEVARPDGATAWYETVKAPFRDASGRVTATVGAARDVTRRRTAEERMRRMVERLAYGAVYVEGERMTANRAVQAITGWAPEELTTLDEWFGRLYGEQAATVRALYDADRAAGLGRQRVVALRHRDGSIRWVEFGGTVGEGFEVWVLHDVTARHEAEVRLERQRRVLEDLQALATIGSWEWDTRSGRVELSAELRRIYGFGVDEPLTVAQYLERVHPDDLPRIHAMIERALQRPEPLDLDHRIVRRDGVVRLLHMRGRPIVDAKGAIEGYVGSSQDVTDRAQLEARLAQAEKLEAVGQLAGGVAHDFNNLLTAIIGNLDLVAAAVPPTDPARLDLAEARRAAERAAELTRQLLAYGRRQVLSPRLLDVNAVLAENAVLLRRALPTTMTFEVAPAPSVPHVRADPGQLVRVLMNLVLNARDAVRAAGGGTVRIETGERRIDDVASRRGHGGAAGAPAPGRYVAIVVADTGTGMDAATRARAFEPFFTTKPIGEGTGLGLATVFGIVAQSGGTVQVESEPGRGTTFTVLLPAVDEEDDAAPAPDAPRGAETVLVVEDDASVRGVARRMLERHGYTVFEAEHGVDALGQIEHRGDEVDLVLTDVRMPGLDGRELARRLRAARPSLPVVLMSGYPSESATAADLRFLAKPFTAGALLHTVRDALDAE